MNDRPNVLVITAHDIGRHLGCYGHPELDTPNLDGLAATGVRFSRMFSTAPQCSPSRASYGTGRYPHETGVLGICSPVFGFDLENPEDHLARRLASVGYDTAGIGIVHETLRPAELFHRYQRERDAAAISSAAEAEIGNWAGSAEPHYLQVGYFEAHRPFPAPAQCRESVHIPPWLTDEPSAQEDLRGFQHAVGALDAAVGRVLRAAEPRRENTVVVFLSDHGIPFPRAKHSLYEPGCQVAALIRWPQRGWSGGRAIEGLASGVDIAPTLLDAADAVRSSPTAPGPSETGGSAGGFPADAPSADWGVSGRPGEPVSADKGDEARRQSNAAPWLGRSLVPALNGGETGRDAVYTEQTFNAYLDPSRAVRTERYKLIANFSPGRGFFDSSQEWRPKTEVRFIADSARTYHPPLELYDLESDPLEQINLAEDPAFESVRVDLAGRIREWMIATGDPLVDGLPNPPLYQWTKERLGFR